MAKKDDKKQDEPVTAGGDTAGSTSETEKGAQRVTLETTAEKGAGVEQGSGAPEGADATGQASQIGEGAGQLTLDTGATSASGQPLAPAALAPESQFVATPLEFPGLHDELDLHARAAAKALEHEAHALLNEIVVAAGALKRKVAAAHGKLSGAAAELIDGLHRFL